MTANPFEIFLKPFDASRKMFAEVGFNYAKSEIEAELNSENPNFDKMFAMMVYLRMCKEQMNKDFGF